MSVTGVSLTVGELQAFEFSQTDKTFGADSSCKRTFSQYQDFNSRETKVVFRLKRTTPKDTPASARSRVTDEDSQISSDVFTTLFAPGGQAMLDGDEANTSFEGSEGTSSGGLVRRRRKNSQNPSGSQQNKAQLNKSKKTPKILSTLDCLKSPYFSLGQNVPMSPVSIHGIHNGKWIPPRSPYNLIQEDLYHEPWQLLIATIFLNCTSGKLAIPIIHEFLARWPGPHEACSASMYDILEVVELLGLGRTRAATIIRFSHEFLTLDWKKPTELYGIGKYGNDSYKVFCLGQWKSVESDDKYLNLYLNWMHTVHGRLHPIPYVSQELMDICS